MTSQFFITHRLKPTQAFEEFEGLAINFEDTYEIQIRGDLAWLGFKASPEEWQNKWSEGLSHMRTYLSALALQKEFPFDVEPIQWIEVPQGQNTNYVLGRMTTDEPVPQHRAPKVDRDDFLKARNYVIIGQISPFFRRAMIDYSVALSFPREAVVFVARALEAVETHFRLNENKVSSGKTKQSARDRMKNELCLPSSALKEFFKIANETTVARHVRKPSHLRVPTIEEIRFCTVFCRIVLDKFALYLWNENKIVLETELPLPENVNVAEELSRSSEGLQEKLASILSGELK